MIDTPQIVQTESQLMALLHLTVPRDEIKKAMGPGIGEVMAALAGQGIAPSGPWFTHHLKRPDTSFDFEICVPVATRFVPNERVRSGEWPAMNVVRTVYRGGYEGLGAAWGEFEGWIVTHGYRPAQDLWERYLVGPESGNDSSKWVTELNRPLAD